MKYRIQVRIINPDTLKSEWKDVRPTGGPAYEYSDRNKAFNMMRMCYPDNLSDTRIRTIFEPGIDFCETCQGDIDSTGQCHCL